MVVQTAQRIPASAQYAQHVLLLLSSTSQTLDASSVTHHVLHAISILEIAPHAEMELNCSLMLTVLDTVDKLQIARFLTVVPVLLLMLKMLLSVKDVLPDISLSAKIVSLAATQQLYG